MSTIIGNYRGFQIVFEPENERFSYKLDEGSWHEKQSYGACKKNIDDYLKKNATFTPFKVRHWVSGKVITIIGIRKDNRLNYEDEIGSKNQMGDYYEKDYIEFKEDDEKHYAQMALYELEKDKLDKLISAERNKVAGTNLKALKEKYIH